MRHFTTDILIIITNKSKPTGFTKLTEGAHGAETSCGKQTTTTGATTTTTTVGNGGGRVRAGLQLDAGIVYGFRVYGGPFGEPRGDLVKFHKVVRCALVAPDLLDHLRGQLALVEVDEMRVFFQLVTIAILDHGEIREVDAYRMDMSLNIIHNQEIRTYPERGYREG